MTLYTEKGDVIRVRSILFVRILSCPAAFPTIADLCIKTETQVKQVWPKRGWQDSLIVYVHELVALSPCHAVGAHAIDAHAIGIHAIIPRWRFVFGITAEEREGAWSRSYPSC